MLNLNSKIDFSFGQFFRWWKKELAFLLPESIRQAFSDKSGFLLLTARDEIIELDYVLGDEEPQALASLKLGDEGKAQYEALRLTDEKIVKARPVLRLGEHHAISRSLILPKAAEENLNQVMAYELDRYTPFKPEQVYHALKKNAQENPGSINFELVVTPKQQLDEICDVLKDWGIQPLLADYEGLPNTLDDDHADYNLLPPSRQKKRDRTGLFLQSALIAGALSLFVVAIVLPVWLEYKAVSVLEGQVKKIGKTALEVGDMRQEIDKIHESNDWLTAQKTQSPTMLELLNTLSLLLKDDTWLTQTRYRNQKLTLYGFSPVASTLIGTLESSELFSNVRFVSSVTPDKKTGMDRFQISADVNSRINHATDGE